MSSSERDPFLSGRIRLDPRVKPEDEEEIEYFREDQIKKKMIRYKYKIWLTVFLIAISVNLFAMDSSTVNNASGIEEHFHKSENWFLKYLLPPIITLLVALVSFYWAQYYFNKKDFEKKKERGIQLLKVLLSEIKRNLDIEGQLHSYFFSKLNQHLVFHFLFLKIFLKKYPFSLRTVICLI